MVSQADDVSADAKVLHYPATHYDRLFRKYDHLKEFPAVRFGGGLVVPPSFHLEARDCYVEHIRLGKDVAKEKLKVLLEHAALPLDPADIEREIRTGTVVFIDHVSRGLQKGFW